MLGKPPKYDSPEVFAAQCELYFAMCDAHTIEKVTKDKKLTIKQPLPYTIIGLAQFLNLTREGLRFYGLKPDFADIVKSAKERCELNLVNRCILNRAETTGAIFVLKCNHRYVEKSQVDNISSDHSMTPKNNELTEEELEAELKKRGLKLPLED